MRKLVLALAATLAFSTVAHADGYMHHNHGGYQHNGGYRQNGGGDAGMALFGGLVGGMILGGMLNQNQGYYQQPQYYQQYQPVCQRYYQGSVWNGYQWVQTFQTICN